MNVADYLLENADNQQIAIITNKNQYSYRDLKEASVKIQNALISSGIQPQEKVGVLGENSLFWVASYLAILKIGAIAVPFPTISTPDELRKKVDFIQPQVICVDARSHRKFFNVLNISDGFILDEVLLKGDKKVKESDSNGREFDDQQDAAYMLTSGTTAVPRAVRITHHNIKANTNSIIEYLDLNNSDRMLVVLPFYYCFGTSLLHTHLRMGGSLVLCNTFTYPETALDMLENYECTGFAGVPSIYQILLRNTTFPKRKFNTLRKVQQAGGKLPKVFIKELMKALPETQVFVMYGQTEATARLSFLPPDLLNTKLGSIGKGIPGVTLRVLNEKGEEVKPGETGEIFAWGDNISPGYFNDPLSSADKFINGSLRTGDLATIDEEGFIYIVDRKADFIKSFGYRVSSQEIEAYILEIPQVIAAAAVGEPDLIQGEAIRVFVTLRKGTALSPQDILAHCHKRMARHMLPKEVVIVERLPTNSHGKVVKAALRSKSTTD